MRVILKKLKKVGLYIYINKCNFFVKKILYLEIIMGKHSIEINSIKITAVKD